MGNHETYDQSINRDQFGRRDKWLPFLGPPSRTILFGTPPTTQAIPGRYFEEWESGKPLELNNKPFEDQKRIASAIHALEYIFDVPTISDIPGIITNKKYQNPQTKEELGFEEFKKNARRRLTRFLAWRHNVNLNDSSSESFPVESGIAGQHLKNLKLNTRKEIPSSMSVEDFERTIEQGVSQALSIRKSLTDPQSGALKGISNIQSGGVTELQGITDLVDLMMIYASPKWTSIAKSECASLIGMSEAAIEILLYQPRVKEARRIIMDVFNHAVFTPESHGPSGEMRYLTQHNPINHSVEGVQPLEPEEQYDPNPWIIYTRLATRQVRTTEGETFPVHYRDETKGILQTALKMIRKNTFDPSKINDLYRMAIVVTDRTHIYSILETLADGSSKLNDEEIQIVTEENTLEGEDFSAKHAGSSKKYQVYRVQLFLKNQPDTKVELSMYTLEAWSNYLFDLRYAIGPYIIDRQISRKVEEDSGSVFDYVFPEDIYGLNLSDYRDSLVAGEEHSIYQRAFSRSPDQKKIPVTIREQDLARAVQKIAQSIYIGEEKEGELPEVLIAVGDNTVTPANQLRVELSIPPALLFDGKIEDIESFIANHKTELSGKRVLILDDIGDKARKVSKFTSLLPNSKSAFLITKKDSVAQSIATYTGGLEIDDSKYAFFPTQLYEFSPQSRGAFVIGTRIQNGRREVLLQEEHSENSDNPKTKYKLPGGLLEENKEDGNGLETVRRELDEELGPLLKYAIASRLLNRFPIQISTQLNSSKPQTPINTLHLQGYPADLSGIEISKNNIPEGLNTPVQNLIWASLEDAINMVSQEGFKKLLKTYQASLNQL